MVSRTLMMIPLCMLCMIAVVARMFATIPISTRECIRHAEYDSMQGFCLDSSPWLALDDVMCVTLEGATGGKVSLVRSRPEA